MLAALPKGNRRWILTLHNGGIAAMFHALPFWRRRLIKAGLARVELLLCLSNKQYIFYRVIGISPNKIQRVRSYIKPLPLDSIYFPKTRAASIDEFNRTCQIIISGYALPHYRLDWLLEFSEANPTLSARFLFCIYGEGSAQIEAELIRHIDRDPRAQLFRDLDSDQFNYLLASSDIYVRPVTCDSFGIAVADAVNFGLRVIASDCCERYPGTLVYPTDDQVCFNRLLMDAVQHASTMIPSQLSPHSLDDAAVYREIYHNQLKAALC
jgi:hypothetical protein